MYRDVDVRCTTVDQEKKRDFERQIAEHQQELEEIMKREEELSIEDSQCHDTQKALKAQMVRSCSQSVRSLFSFDSRTRS